MAGERRDGRNQGSERDEGDTGQAGESSETSESHETRTARKAHKGEARPPSTIAIDGPAASGKSTIGKRLVEELNRTLDAGERQYVFLDTGMLYRAVALSALRRDISPQDGPSLAALADSLNIRILAPDPAETDGRTCTLLLGGEDVTSYARSPEVDKIVSSVSKHPQVRQVLLPQQRRIAGEGRVVMVGRDITTNVLPNADLKIYLNASVEERARRRLAEEQTRGVESAYVDIEEGIRRRDKEDRERADGPLRETPEQVRVHNEGALEDTLGEIMRLVLRWPEK